MLARQAAFIVPLCMPLIGAAALYRLDWFYPAFMIVVGAHYLPFSHLYGTWQYEVLGATLIAASLAIGLWYQSSAWAHGSRWLCSSYSPL